MVAGTTTTTIHSLSDQELTDVSDRTGWKLSVVVCCRTRSSDSTLVPWWFAVAQVDITRPCAVAHECCHSTSRDSKPTPHKRPAVISVLRVQLTCQQQQQCDANKAPHGVCTSTGTVQHTLRGGEGGERIYCVVGGGCPEEAERHECSQRLGRPT